MNETKTITINPGLLTNKKTKKNTSKLINKTLINRIKRKKVKKEEKPVKSDNKFDECDNFLSNILQKHPKTMKVHTPLDNYAYSPINKSVENLLFKPDNSDALNINYEIDTATPYGNLSRGLKPTLKKWKLGKKITFPTHVKEIVYSEVDEERRIAESEINKELNGKTEFSTDLLKSFQNQPEEKLTISNEDINIEAEVIGTPELNPIVLDILPEVPLELKLEPLVHIAQPLVQPLVQPRAQPSIRIKPNLREPEPEEQEERSRTVKLRYNLGKKKGGSDVGLIISNKTTRKNVTELIKQMKLTSCDTMKKELKKRGLINVGSTAPLEVVKKIYECSQLAGDICNENKEILMNNLLNDN